MYAGAFMRSSDSDHGHAVSTLVCDHAAPGQFLCMPHTKGVETRLVDAWVHPLVALVDIAGKIGVPPCDKSD